MPGIYINDQGGGISSALGNALGGLADSMDPKTQAQARLLAQQIEEAKRNNWLLSTRQRGVLDVPSALGAAGADPGSAPSAPATGSVAGDLSAAAQPPVDPMSPDVRDPTRNFSPYAGVVAGSYANDPSMANFQTGVNLGRDITKGPGADYPTQNDIAKAKAVPYDLTVGTTRHVPGGALPETTVSGGDAGQAEAQKAALLSTQKDADSRASLAEAATNTQNDLIQAKQLYNSLVGATDVKSVIGDGMITWLSNKTGLSIQQLSDPAQARLAIKAMLKTSIGSSLAAVQGDPNAGPIRGILQQTNDSMPDPDTMNDTQFNAGIDRMLKVTSRQMSYGAPARTFRLSGQSKADADAYNQQLEAIRAKQEAENAAEASGGGRAAGGGEIHVYKTPQDAQADIDSGQLHKGDRVRIGGSTFTVGD